MTRHLIHIGYPKTGSTFLQHWFAAHPQLAFCDWGIAGFQDVYTMARDSVTSPAPAYRVTSSERLAAPHATAGETALAHAPGATMRELQAAVCGTLQALFANAVILVVTRGFRAMILSSYSQYVRSGGDLDPATFLAPETRDASMAGYSGTADPWDYDALIGMYVQAFGRDNVIVMPYELLRDDSDAFVRVLGERLQLDFFSTSRERVNVSLSPAELYWYPRLSRRVRRFAPQPLLRRYVGITMNNRFRFPIRALSWLRRESQEPVTVPDAIVESYRGRASSLRNDPLYAPYAADYLF